MFFHLFFFDNDESNISEHCNLSGLEGEKAEFSAVRWSAWEEVISDTVEFRKATYERLRVLAEPAIKKRLEQPVGAQAA